MCFDFVGIDIYIFKRVVSVDEYRDENQLWKYCDKRIGDRRDCVIAQPREMTGEYYKKSIK